MIWFADWLELAREYARLMYAWADFTDAEARQSFDCGDTPADFVDALAHKYGLDSYADVNFGAAPAAFQPERYRLAPTQKASP